MEKMQAKGNTSKNVVGLEQLDFGGLFFLSLTARNRKIEHGGK
jgi:hypothetical protein